MSKLTFEFDKDGEHEFQCTLQCGQCDYVKADGLRCKNRVCIGYPTCWVHNKKSYNVQVRVSPGRGRGLFATSNIPKDSWICPYNGEVISRKCLEARYPGDHTAPYAITIRKDVVLDAACERGVGSMANGLFRENGKVRAVAAHNAIFRNRQDGIWLKSTKNIKNGEEIFAWYSENYNVHEKHATRRKRQQLDTRPC